MDVHIDTDAALSVDWRIYNNNQPDLVDPVFNADGAPPSANYANGTYAFTAGQKLLAIRNISKHARGTTYSISLSGTSLASPSTFRIYGFMLHVAESGIRRSN
jgi:lipoprotein-anchoring transpeptidase ErfK/SrfK